MPSVYGGTNSAPQAAASDTEILKYIQTATEILTDLKRAGPPGKKTAVDRLAVLNQMIKLKIESRLKK